MSKSRGKSPWAANEMEKNFAGFTHELVLGIGSNNIPVSTWTAPVTRRVGDLYLKITMLLSKYMVWFNFLDIVCNVMEAVPSSDKRGVWTLGGKLIHQQSLGLDPRTDIRSILVERINTNTTGLPDFSNDTAYTKHLQDNRASRITVRFDPNAHGLISTHHNAHRSGFPPLEDWIDTIRGKDTITVYTYPSPVEKRQLRMMITDPLPGAMMGDISGKLFRKTNPVTGEFEARNINAIDHDHPDLLQLTESLQNSTPTEAWLQIKESSKVLKKMVAALRIMDDDASHGRIFDILRGIRLYDTEGDLFEGLDDTALEILNERAGRMTLSQQEALTSLERMFRDVSMINGAPGTGKTEIMCLIAVVLMAHCPEMLQVLVVAKTNDQVDAIHQRIVESAQHYPATRNRIIMRHHAQDTELGAVETYPETLRRDQQRRAAEVNEPDELQEMFTTTLLRKHDKKSDSYNFSNGDPRFHYGPSAAGWAVAFSGYNADMDPAFRPHPCHQGESDLNTEFCRALRQLESGAELGAIERNANRATFREMIGATIQNTSVVVTTPMRCAETRMRNNFDPKLVLIDEAGNINEGELWLITAYRQFAKYILFGDRNQSAIQSQAVDGFHRQYRMGLFKRLHNLSFPRVTLREQQRMPKQIAEIVASMAQDYTETMIILNIPDSPPTTTMKAFFLARYGIEDTCTLWIDIDGQEEKGPTKSVFNLDNAHYGICLYIAMLEYGIPSNHIVFQVTYRAQQYVYICILTHMRTLPKYQVYHVELTPVITTLSNQGATYIHVITDLSRTDAPGYLNQGPLVRTAASRANGSSTVLADFNSIRQTMKVPENTALGKWYYPMRERGWLVAKQPAISRDQLHECIIVPGFFTPGQTNNDDTTDVTAMRPVAGMSWDNQNEDEAFGEIIHDDDVGKPGNVQWGDHTEGEEIPHPTEGEEILDNATVAVNDNESEEKPKDNTSEVKDLPEDTASTIKAAETKASNDSIEEIIRNNSTDEGVTRGLINIAARIGRNGWSSGEIQAPTLVQSPQLPRHPIIVTENLSSQPLTIDKGSRNLRDLAADLEKKTWKPIVPKKPLSLSKPAVTKELRFAPKAKASLSTPIPKFQPNLKPLQEETLGEEYDLNLQQALLDSKQLEEERILQRAEQIQQRRQQQEEEDRILYQAELIQARRGKARME